MKFAGKLCALSLAGALMALFAIAEPLTIKADTTVPVKLRGKAGSVVLGNQRIADVAVRNQGCSAELAKGIHGLYDGTGL